jgi:hypothetical protein
MSSIQRPVTVLVVALVYLAVGVVGFSYHFPALWAWRQGSVWVELSECLALAAGGFLLRAPGRAHLLGGASPLHTRQGEVLAERQGCPSRGGI